MYRVIILGTDVGYDSILLTCERHGDIEVCGVLATDNIHGCIDNIPIIGRNELIKLKYDYCIIPEFYNYNDTVKKLKFLIPPNKIISHCVMNIHGFTFEKYKKLKKSNLTIISINCMGGYMYHRMCLPFLTPTINLRFDEEHYLNFISDLKKLIKEPLKYVNKEWDEEEKCYHPVCKLGKDVIVRMVHDTDFEEAVNKWNRRKGRINWKNILYIMYTSNENILKRFDALPLEKKVCFVPFESSLPSAWFYPNDIRLHPQHPNDDTIPLRISDGSIPAYDMWDLMLYGKKTPRMSKLLMNSLACDNKRYILKYKLIYIYIYANRENISEYTENKIATINTAECVLRGIKVSVSNVDIHVSVRVFMGDKRWYNLDENGYIVGAESGIQNPIRGIAMSIESQEQKYRISYKVRFAGDIWSEWISDGQGVHSSDSCVDGIQIKIDDL